MRILAEIYRLVSRNFPYKVLSILIAVVLWTVVQHGRYREVDFIIPLELRDIPPAFALSGEPKSIHITARASKEVVEDLTSQQFRAAVSMRKATVGENIIRVTPGAVTSPAGVQVKSVSPNYVSVAFDYRRRIQVVPVITGSPAEGFLLKNYTVIPERVEVIGRDMDDVSAVEHAATQPIPLDGAENGFQTVVGLAPLPKGVRYVGEPEVRVTLVLERMEGR